MQLISIKWFPVLARGSFPAPPLPTLRKKWNNFWDIPFNQDYDNSLKNKRCGYLFQEVGKDNASMLIDDLIYGMITSEERFGRLERTNFPLSKWAAKWREVLEDIN